MSTELLIYLSFLLFSLALGSIFQQKIFSLALGSSFFGWPEVPPEVPLSDLSRRVGSQRHVAIVGGHPA